MTGNTSELNQFCSSPLNFFLFFLNILLLLNNRIHNVRRARVFFNPSSKGRDNAVWQILDNRELELFN
jgi:hypothetical protein